ncbi:MAG: phosphatase, partial [bacterium]|nr:phosphatase [bacterium]
MKGLEAIIGMFKKSGGCFCIPAVELEKKIRGVRGFVFDWDGVFHIGHKGEGHSGVFSESDSMGTNMLRYGYWRMHGELPFMAIISGERDKTASMFAERESFHAVYTGIRDKKNALEHACGKVGVEPSQMGCVFDDINDLAMARYCGLRVQVRRSASPLFMEYTARGGGCDYITGHSAHEHAVR